MIECFFAENVDLFLLGYTFAGLYEQHHETVKLRRADWIRHPLSAALDLGGLRVGIEVSDHSDYWDFSLLEWCDVYVKRSINSSRSVPLQHKIIPFGLNMGCHSRHSALAVLAAIAGTLPKASKARLREVYRYLVTPHWKSFEYRPEQPTENTILFQTRLWGAQGAPGDEVIDEQRVSLLRALRREFGRRVVGGLVPTPFAQKTYPDLITNQACRQPQYIRWAKKPLIGIYSRGLYDSIAFKMAEYMAASKCIVSEPIANELPVRLDHLSICRSNDECVAACERLLADKSLAAFSRQKSWDYYEAQVMPQAHMAGLLKRARAAYGRLQSGNVEVVKNL
ncbi:MAG: hypothetical protein ABR956_04285 [Terracidiphilus sp.]